MTRWFAVLLAALLLLPQPVQAETLETLYGRALQPVRAEISWGRCRSGIRCWSCRPTMPPP